MSSPRSTTPSDDDRPGGDGSGPRRLVVIAQPEMDEAREFVTRLHDADGIDVELVETTTEDEVAQAVRSAVDDGVDSIASVGGDGALNLVVGAVVDASSSGNRGENRRKDGPAVVPVRAGTVNLVSQTLGLGTVEVTAESVRADRTRPIDVGDTGQGHFVLNASTGYDAAVIDDADEHSGATFGRLHFLLEGLKRLRHDEPVPVRVTCDGSDVFDGPAMSVVLMNIGQRGSDGFDVAPDAEFDDGLIDVAVIRAETVRRFAGVVVRLAFGRPVERRDVVRAQAAQIDIEWSEPVASQRDGDADDDVTALSVRVLPRALRIHHAAEH